MKVMMSDPALDDVEGIERYWADKNPGAARKLTKELFARARSLAAFPRRGRIVPELGQERVRELIVGDYRVMYEIDDERGVVAVLAVLHGRRSFPTGRVHDR